MRARNGLQAVDATAGSKRAGRRWGAVRVPVAEPDGTMQHLADLVATVGALVVRRLLGFGEDDDIVDRIGEQLAPSGVQFQAAPLPNGVLAILAQSANGVWAGPRCANGVFSPRAARPNGIWGGSDPANGVLEGGANRANGVLGPPGTIQPARAPPWG